MIKIVFVTIAVFMPLTSFIIVFQFTIKTVIFFSFLLVTVQSNAQEKDTLKEVILNEVIVKAFDQNKNLRNVPAAIGVVGRQTLERFNNVSIVSAVNTLPGIRMEERSPGSYRLNIRGSALRSPFGVRNVKVYFNDIPYTDPGGHTYLNSLGYKNFESIEIIKGPGSSLYGAGTGGVMLIQSFKERNDTRVELETGVGSFRTKNFYAGVKTGNEKSINKIGFEHQQSNGYRNHSSSEKNIFEWTSNFIIDENKKMTASFLYSDLFYKTPGALTLTEFNKDPKMARPAAGIFPSAENARAAIYQKTFLAGVTYSQNIIPDLINKTTLYGAFIQLKNPAIRNYGINNEPHVGGRTTFKFSKIINTSKIIIDAGAEMQQGFANFSVHSNVNGTEGNLQTYDEVLNNQAFLFSQISLEVDKWSFIAGASINRFLIKFKRLHPTPLPLQKIKFKNEVAPRFALLRSLDNISLYTSISKGFSPPAITELAPTGSNVNLGLNAEEGINYDIGSRGNVFNKLWFDVNIFLFKLNNTIVQRRDAGGGDYFINAGKTEQFGVETSLNLPVFKSISSINKSSIWFNHTYHYFKYEKFIQVDNDFSGNHLPGIAPHTIAAGFDADLKNGLSGHLTYYFSDKIPLNDVNDSYADQYHLVGLKIGYSKTLANHFNIKLSAGVDNLLDEKYSLGNDINAFGGRYYNTASTRNYFVTLNLEWIK